jgi:hypothetical protein
VKKHRVVIEEMILNKILGKFPQKLFLKNKQLIMCASQNMIKKNDLKREVEVLSSFCVSHGWLFEMI